MLQTRVGKRTAAAALRMAVEMAERGPHRPAGGGAARRSPRSSTSSCTRSSTPTATYDALAKGLNASPGAAVGKVYFTADDAEAARTRRARHVILVRPETSPDDLHGMIAAEGILTSRGGLVSHAAVVARGMGTPAVCGADELADRRRGRAVRGRAAPSSARATSSRSTAPPARSWSARCRWSRPSPTGPFETMLGWADEFRTHEACARTPTCPQDAAGGARVRRRGHRALPHRAHVPRRPAAARAAVHPRRRPKPRSRPRSTSSRSSSAPTSSGSSRRWTGCPSPSGCSTRRCTSSSPTSRSCSCSDAQGRARRRGPRAARAPRSSGARRTRCSARAACRLGDPQARALPDAGAAISRRRSSARTPGGDPQVEIMIPLVVTEAELALLDRLGARGRRRGVSTRPATATSTTSSAR